MRKFINTLWIFSLVILIIGLIYCRRDEIRFHGELSGMVTDYMTGQPLEGAKLKVSGSHDSTFTDDEGKYLFRNVQSGDA